MFGFFVQPVSPSDGLDNALIEPGKVVSLAQGAYWNGLVHEF